MGGKARLGPSLINLNAIARPPGSCGAITAAQLYPGCSDIFRISEHRTALPGREQLSKPTRNPKLGQS